MARVKRGIRKQQKRKKLLGMARGYRGGRSKLKRQAKEAVLKAGNHAFAGRKNKKRNFRRLWIQRLSAASHAEGISYNKLISFLKKENIKIDRKILANIAQNDPQTFKAIIKNLK